MRIALSLAASALVTGLLAVSSPAATASGTLLATVGPGFTITMNAKTVKAGTYKIVVKDKSNIHNFHLMGPGVNKLTSVKGVGTFTWNVTLKPGVYKYVCDPHKSFMKGVLKVT